MSEIQAVQIIDESGIKTLLDQAHYDRRLSIAISPDLWDRLLPAVRILCGQYFRQMFSPWRSFMYDGIWLERA